MTSKRHWQTRLTEALRPEPGADPPRVAVVGVGHELNGDDIAGVLVARALMPLTGPRDDLQVIDAGPAPENVTGALRRFAPDVILFVDAAELQRAPGTVEWIGWQDITGISASTHTLPLNIVAGYLRRELGSEVALLGIQPADVSPGAAVSAAVEQAVTRVVGAIYESLGASAAS